jgi:hypothetical protein
VVSGARPRGWYAWPPGEKVANKNPLAEIALTLSEAENCASWRNSNQVLIRQIKLHIFLFPLVEILL